ncbi:hypothetical protein SAMN05518871_101302 [Psychrobacillus sp. OK028]|uniref:hypothetical protein n=1 Tax=Psychrobacillus sp. OK028 TaxID=1884359 RepID=UPI00088FCF8C|nr:hypothetical protein [Psychrobacillus sp. OK028]SDM46849.1 hypothetical protein SAMN05518871_101302 [Psychrobacillus sp. OK028]
MNKKTILSLVDKVVKVDRGGPESRVGKVLAAKDDYFILLTEDDGIIYYNIQHIKSITYNSKKQMDFNVVIPRDFEYIQADDFKGVLEKLSLHWVKINRGGPETLEGVMDVVTDEVITIVANEEIIHLAMFHIRNISYGVKIEKTKDTKNNNAKKEAKTEAKTDTNNQENTN